MKPFEKNENEILLKQFFSRCYQQSTLYTCGPAVVKMVADYYLMIEKNKDLVAKFGPIDPSFKALSDENYLIDLFETSQEEGTNHLMMFNKLKELGYFVYFAQAELNFDAKFPNSLVNLIKEGLPFIVNYTLYYTRYSLNDCSIGHYGLVHAINDQSLIISDPAAYLTNREEATIMRIEDFLKVWRSGSGLPGIYLILFPNQRSFQSYLGL